MIEIKQIYNKEQYIDLLLEADPEKDIVEKYLQESEMYGLFEDDKILAEVVITKVDNDNCELKNIATTENARGKGYGKQLIQEVTKLYKNIKINNKPVHLVHAKSIQDKEENNEKTLGEMIKEGNENKIHEALWSRDPDKSIASPHPQSARPGVFTVIGHSPTDDNKVNYKDDYMDIDCGGGYNYCSLVNLTKGTVKYIDNDFEKKKEKMKNEKSKEK